MAHLEACPVRRDRLLVVLLRGTGMRIGQALGPRHADVTIEATDVARAAGTSCSGSRSEARASNNAPIAAAVPANRVGATMARSRTPARRDCSATMVSRAPARGTSYP